MQLRFNTSARTKVRFFTTAKELEAALRAKASFALRDPRAPARFSGASRELAEGEACKRWAELGASLEWLSQARAERGAWLAGIGGGAALDLAGFTASLYRRGMPLLFVPTTLLAMVDATLGGKTAVDAESSEGGLLKNFAGTFYPASEVWIHTGYLSSLPRRERLSGAGECWKTLWIAGKKSHGEALFDFVAGGAPGAELAALVKLCLKEKLRVVEQDPLDTKRIREILNYGHTVGHALESLAGGRLAHGECVLWGMRAESALLGRRGIEMAARVEAVITKLGLEQPLEFSLPPARWEAALSADKKAAKGLIAMTVLEAPGKPRKLALSARKLAIALTR